MTPEEVKDKKAEILKDIQRNTHCLTRKSVEIQNLQRQLNHAEGDRENATRNIKTLMREYYLHTLPEVYSVDDDKTSELAWAALQKTNDYEMLELVLSILQKQQAI